MTVTSLKEKSTSSSVHSLQSCIITDFVSVLDLLMLNKRYSKVSVGLCRCDMTLRKLAVFLCC